MKWLLVYISISYSGNMQYIEFNNEEDCQSARKVLLNKAGRYDSDLGKRLVCVHKSN